MSSDPVLDRLDSRLGAVEQKLSALAAQQKYLAHTVSAMTLLLLLTVIYGAVGERGFHTIRQSSQEPAYAQETP
ncbi:MAG: hypothetical protein ACI4QD_04745 [Kiritimatiellia bacterium]